MGVIGPDGEGYIGTPGGTVRIDEGSIMNPSQRVAIMLGAAKTITMCMIDTIDATVLQQTLLKQKTENVLSLYTEYLDAVTENNSEKMEALSTEKTKKLQEISQLLGEIDKDVEDEIIGNFQKVDNLLLQVGKGDQPYHHF